jgi:hypothetical protein
MKLTVKTLKGGKFEVDCEPSNTVLEVKGIVVSRSFLFFDVSVIQFVRMAGLDLLTRVAT